MSRAKSLAVTSNAKDLTKRHYLHIIPFLTSLISLLLMVRMRETGRKMHTPPEELEAISRIAQTMLEKMLEDAVEFCNSTDTHCVQLKKSISYLYEAKDEGERSVAFSTCLNIIMQHFREKAYDGIPASGSRTSMGKELLINKDSNSTKSTNKYGTPAAASLEKTLPDTMNVQEIWRPKRRGGKQLTVADKIWSLDELIPSVPQHVSPSPLRNSTNPEYPPSTNNLRKRRRSMDDDGNLSPPKLQRTGEAPIPCPVLRLDVAKAHDDDIWCAVQKIEVELVDSSLILRWSDAHGCIESYPFDILQSLPLFVVSTMIIHRFGAQNLDLSPKDWAMLDVNHVVDCSRKAPHSRTMFPYTRPLDSTNVNNSLPQDIQTQLRRSARNSSASPSTQMSSAAPPADNLKENGQSDNVESSEKDDIHSYCCKIYWPETTRDKEPLIIEEAIKRVTLHLPEEYRHMVLKHLPEVVIWEEDEEGNTYDVLLHAKLAGATIDISEGQIIDQGLTSVVMISRTLQEGDDLTPAQFWKVFWDIVRCLYLLWKVGIAHGDVSITNMMCKEVDQNLLGVLNDFSSAAIMEIGARSPENAGFERTGTVPFMALDVLKYYEGQIRRWFRHDLESSTWCLVWRVLMKNPDERETWCTGTFEAYAFKRLLFTDLTRKMIDEDWKPYYDPILEWLFVWKRVHDEMSLKTIRIRDARLEFDARDRLDRVDTNESSMRASVVAVVKGIAETTGAVKPEMVDVLVDTSWIDVQLINVPTESS